MFFFVGYVSCHGERNVTTVNHYIDVMMTTMASQITSLTVVYSTGYSDADQRKHQSSASLAFVWGIHRGRWTPRTKGQLRGKCFHLMTSSCRHGICWYSPSKFTFACWPQATFVKDVYLEMPGKIAIEKQTDTILLWTQRSSNEIYVLPSVGLITCPLYHVICT